MLLKFSLKARVTNFIVFLHLFTAFLAIFSFILLLINEFKFTLLALIGLIFVVIGILLIITAISTIKSQAIIPKNLLITKGIYSKIRNPIYLGLISIVFGSIFLSFSIYIIIYFLFLTILYLIIIKREEKELINRFGKTYEEYRKKVPSLIPKL